MLLLGRASGAWGGRGRVDAGAPRGITTVADATGIGGIAACCAAGMTSVLVDLYGVDPDRISVIPHGADPGFAGPSLVKDGAPLILTWGLIGPGKGLEWAIRALEDLSDMRPLPRYLIAGATHPEVKRTSGESYRDSLTTLTRSLGLDPLVRFDDRYLDRQSLARLVRSADVVVLPYESADQVTSGVLVEAIAASRSPRRRSSRSARPSRSRSRPRRPAPIASAAPWGCTSAARLSSRPEHHLRGVPARGHAP